MQVHILTMSLIIFTTSIHSTILFKLEAMQVQAYAAMQMYVTKGSNVCACAYCWFTYTCIVTP